MNLQLNMESEGGHPLKGSFNLAHPQFFWVVTSIGVRAGRAPGAGKIGGRTLPIHLPILSPKRESGLEDFAR
jgi:hypothetical protein